MKLPARYMLTAASVAAIAFLLAAGTTIYFWMHAIWGVGIFLVAMTPIVGYAALGGFVLDPTKTKDAIASDDSPPLPKRVLGMVLPLITASVPFLALLGAWHTPTARAFVGDASSSLGMRMVAERALTDDAPMVAIAGCNAVTELGGAPSKDLIVGRLFVAQDEELVRCLLHALPGELKGESSARLQLLAAKWERELWDEEIEPERACATADHLRQAERAGVDLASPRLLTCAVGAPQTTTRQCCAQSLRGSMGGAPSVAGILPSPERAIETSGLAQRAHLLVTAPRAADAEVVAILGLDEPEFGAWSLGVGCEAMRIWQPDIRRRAGEAMAARLEPTCDVEAPEGDKVAVWVQACSEATANVVDPNQLDDALCRGLSSRFMQEVVAVARRDLHRAKRVAATPPEKRGFLEVFAGLGLLQEAFSNGDAPSSGLGIPMGAGGLPSGFEGMLGSPAFDQVKQMPHFRKMLEQIESTQGSKLDPESIERLQRFMDMPDGMPAR
jgi:hypothetical protein